MYLRVHGKGSKVRAVPLYSDVVDALDRWRELREEIPELAGDPWLFPRLGASGATVRFSTPAGSCPPAR